MQQFIGLMPQLNRGGVALSELFTKLAFAFDAQKCLCETVPTSDFKLSIEIRSCVIVSGYKLRSVKTYSPFILPFSVVVCRPGHSNALQKRLIFVIDS